MKFFILIVIVVATTKSVAKKPITKCSCGKIKSNQIKDPKSNAKIFSGQNATNNEYPWQVFIKIEFQNYPYPNDPLIMNSGEVIYPTDHIHMFGGVLISKKHILTISHTFYMPYFNKT